MTEATLIAGQTENAPETQQSQAVEPQGTVPAAESQQQATPAVEGQPATPAVEGQPAAPATPEVKPQGAPEAYADFTLPEGSIVAPEIIEDVKTAAKSLNLSQDQAQHLLDSNVALASKMVAKSAVDWEAATKADKEIGGDALQDNLGYAKKALDAFGSAELKGLLQKSGLGNHPEFVRAFVKVGKAISEDKLVMGGVQPAAKDPRNLYAKSGMNP